MMRSSFLLSCCAVAVVQLACSGKSVDLQAPGDPSADGGLDGGGGSGGDAQSDSPVVDSRPESSIPCDPGWGDCDLDPVNGCEARLDNAENCGECGVVCAAVNAVASCVAGSCSVTCKAGFADCNADPADGCESNLASLANCGVCGKSCGGPNTNASCSGGVCTLECLPGYADCDANDANGCETSLDTSQNCGGCGVVCNGACNAGACSSCEDGLVIDSPSPIDAAKAMGICGGLDDARWVLPDGSAVPPASQVNYDLGHGLLAGFGPNVTPQVGPRMLALSSGTARQPTDPGYQGPEGFDKGYTCGHPQGFPKESPACPGVITGEPHDGAALELTLTVPAQATGLAFRFNFYTYEWPDYICSEFNDFFVAQLSPIPQGLTDGNISFDPQGNPFSVNNALLEACGCTGGPPCVAGGKTFACSLGAQMLTGTGFDAHAASGWLETTAPVAAGSTIKVRFSIYDSGDGILDSTVLIDAFRWLTTPGVTVSTHPI